MIRKVSVLNAVIAVMAVIAVSVGVWELNPLAAQAPPSASRSLSSAPVASGGQVTVTVTADGYGTFGDVEETLPVGFTYSYSSLPDDQVESVGQTVKFALIGETPPTTFTYTVTASRMEGDYSFMGVFSGVDPGFNPFSGVQVDGDSSITVGPATTTPPDTGDGDTGDGDTGTTPPDAGDPTASRSFSPDPVGASGEVTVTITAEGHGSFGEVAETLPAGFTYLESSLPNDQVEDEGQTVTLTLLGATSPTTFTYTVTASSAAGDHPFTGVFSGVDAAVDAFSGVQVGGDASIAVGPAAGPNASRSFSADSVDAGGRVTVTIIAMGHGSFGEVTETLPAGFTYLESSLPNDQVEDEGQTVTLTLLGATSPTTFTYTVTASSAAGDHSFTGVFSGVDADFDAFSGVRVGEDSSITVEPTPTRRPSTGGGSTGGVPVVAPPVQPTPTPAPTAEPTGPVPTPELGQRPSQPHVFTGDVMVGEGMAMEGTEVSAMIDGETVAMAMVMADGTYTLKIDSGDADYSGKMVMFMVGMENVEQSAEWMEGMVSPLNLMVMEPEPTEPPAGMPGPTGMPGPAGMAGADGADGQDGRQGRPRPTRPRRS